jgi:hypothetical protein
MSTRLYLCATHFLKIISKKAKKIKKEKEDRYIVTVFVFAFTLLQNSTSMKEFEMYFVHIYNIFNQPEVNRHFATSLIKVRTDLKYRKFSFGINLNIGDDSKSEESDEINTENFIFENETLSNIKKDSPYNKYFENILKHCKESTIQNIHQDNPLYCPQLFQIIVDYLYLLPLWTGIIISFWRNELNDNDSFTRLTNNPVENWFGHLKNNLLMKRSVMPSELAGTTYNRLQMKYFQYYGEPEELEKKEPKLYEKVEQWQKVKNYKRDKGHYYKNLSSLAEIDGEIDVFVNEAECPELDDLFNISILKSLFIFYLCFLFLNI